MHWMREYRANPHFSKGGFSEEIAICRLDRQQRQTVCHPAIVTDYHWPTGYSSATRKSTVHRWRLRNLARSRAPHSTPAAAPPPPCLPALETLFNRRGTVILRQDCFDIRVSKSFSFVIRPG